MNTSKFYLELNQAFQRLIEKNHFDQVKVSIKARALTPQEGIGNPTRDDFPILKGVEKLIEASFRGARGQAFTDSWGDFSGTLEQVVSLDLNTNGRRAIFIASLNAVMAYLGLAEATVHCRDSGPRECAQELEGLLSEYPQVGRVALVGLQPALLEALTQLVEVRACDLDPNNIGMVKHGVLIEDARDTPDILKWSELALVTGTTVVNGTIPLFLGLSLPVIFFGTTISGVAEMMNLKRYCPRGTPGA